MINPMMGTLSTVGLFSMAVTLLKLCQRALPLSIETERKTMHLITGLALLLLPWLFSSVWVVAMLISIVILGPLLARTLPFAKRLFGRTLQVERKSFGGELFGVSFLLLFLFAHNDKWLYLIPGLVVVFADAAAAIVGINWPYKVYNIAGYRKSVSGSAAFFLVAFVCIFIPLLFFQPSSPSTTVEISVLTAIVATIAEGLSPCGFDNFTVPAVVYVLLKNWLLL